MYLVGIDISKNKHDCFIMTDHGEVIKDSFSIMNNKDGFLFLLNVLNDLNHSQDIRIGLEATGHYGTNLKNFLYDNGYNFAEFNPYIIKKFAESFSLRKTKTDKVDAKHIAQVLMIVPYKTYVNNFNMSSLKSLTRLRSRLVKNRSQYLVHLTNLLDITFPEFKPFLMINLVILLYLS
jgi:transposase